jgi:hypothetical protein
MARYLLPVASMSTSTLTREEIRERALEMDGTLEAIADEIRDRYGVSLAPSTIYRWRQGAPARKGPPPHRNLERFRARAPRVKDPISLALRLAPSRRTAYRWAAEFARNCDT